MTNKDKVALSVVIPVYNEEKNLEPLYERLKEVLEGCGRSYEMIFIDDGSTDGSLAVLQCLAAQDRQLKLVIFRANFGQTSAIAAGIDHSQGEIIIPMDGDLQNDPADIPRLVEKMEEGYEVVSGWRRQRKDAWVRRRIPSMLANKLISLISGVHLHDYGCTLKAYHREVIAGVRLYGEMHRFIPIYARWHGARVAEIEVTHHPRRAGQSKYGVERIAKVLLDLVVIKFLESYAQKPIYVFGGFGIICFLLAFFSGCVALYLKFFRNVSFILTPLPLLTVLLSVIGFISLLMGLIAEIVMRTYFESQNKPTYTVKETVNLSEPEER